jgi:hypothetical protein
MEPMGWEKVTANMLMFKTNSIKILGLTEFSLDDMFPNTKVPQKLLSLKFETPSQFFRVNKSPIQILQNAQIIVKNKNEHSFFQPGTIWINTQSGSIVDLWTIYKNKQTGSDQTGKSYTVLFVQNKFTTTRNAKLTTQMIIDTTKKLNEMWNSLLNETLQQTPELKGKFNFNDYDIVLAFVTNQEIVSNHQVRKSSNSHFQKITFKCSETTFVFEQLTPENENILENYIKVDLESYFTIFSAHVLQLIEWFTQSNDDHTTT